VWVGADRESVSSFVIANDPDSSEPEVVSTLVITNVPSEYRQAPDLTASHQEGVKSWLTTSVAQRSKAVSFSGCPASVELVGRGTSTEPAASLTTLRG
jgi:hypothetical protein